MGKKLSDLPAAEALNNDDLLLIEQGGNAKKLRAAQLKVNGGVSSWDDLTEKPFGEPLEYVTYAYTGVEDSEGSGQERLCDAPADISYLFGGEISWTYGGVTKTTVISPKVFDGFAAVPTDTPGAYISLEFASDAYKSYGITIIDDSLGERTDCDVVVSCGAAGTLSNGIFVPISDGTTVPRVDSLTHPISFTRLGPQYLPEGVPTATDDTLSVEGAAADAKAVGDALKKVTDSMPDIEVTQDENAVNITVTDMDGTKEVQIDKIQHITTLENANVFKLETVTLDPADWYIDGDVYRIDTVQSEEASYMDDIDACIALDIDMINEAARCQVICTERGPAGDTRLTFTAYKGLPAIPLIYNIRVWPNKQLSYGFDSETLTLTVTEE